MSNKRYTEEIKKEAVRQVVDRGYSGVEVARRLGVTSQKPKPGTQTNYLRVCVWRYHTYD